MGRLLWNPKLTLENMVSNEIESISIPGLDEFESHQEVNRKLDMELEAIILRIKRRRKEYERTTSRIRNS